jgi:hypothetical protein
MYATNESVEIDPGRAESREFFVVPPETWNLVTQFRLVFIETEVVLVVRREARESLFRPQ